MPPDRAAAFDCEERPSVREISVREISVTSDGTRLAGTVWSPPVVRLAVLLHPGSGPSDRDNDDLFPPIREMLLSRDVAVASFDKRGVGGSAGDWREAGIEQQARDVVAAAGAVRSLVPHVPFGLFGHSQGGWVVLEAAEMCGADWVITNSGPAVTPLRQESFSAGATLRAHGLDDATVAKKVQLAQHIWHQAVSGASFASYQEWKSERRAEVQALTDLGVFIPDDAGSWRLLAMLGEYDPRDRLAALAVPLLALFGSHDDVVPVAESLAVLTAAVAPQLLHVAVVPGGNHRIRLRDGSFAPGYLEAISDFLTDRMLAA
jgi:pimeloyl-ACP methyl ester carboxylesterase